MDTDDGARSYRSVLAELPKGVTIVATLGDTGPVGSTASAVTSLSLDPPLVLVSLAQQSRTLNHLRRHGTFAVNVLRDRHRQLAESFAVGQSHRERFAAVAYHIHRDTPVLDDALAWVTCRLHATYPGGDHVIVVGEVTGMHRGGGEPLVWHRGAYRRMAGESADGAPTRSGEICYADPGARP
jgi:3-hydroxy-9,10-secoandrosta-1,3,5(10)-triene-9,17-dione monooxygenase reductase component